MALSELTLGCAQLGFHYGISNVHGRPEQSKILDILSEAIGAGVTSFDTARAYGDSESAIGAALSRDARLSLLIITKLDPLATLPPSAPISAAINAADESIAKSMLALNCERLDFLLLHRWSHRKMWNGGVWKRLLEWRDQGKIGLLGVSVVSPEEALEALRDQNIKAIQLPFNILDHRWHTDLVQKAFASRADVAIFARSVYLQGILVSTEQFWPKIPNLDANNWISRIESAAREFGRQNRADLCIAYARAQSWIHSLVIGVETINQLRCNVSWFAEPPLTHIQCDYMRKLLADPPAHLIQPAMWPPHAP